MVTRQSRRDLVHRRTSSYAHRMAHLPTQGHVLDWLVETDPALRWQVERDLLDASESTWQGTRERVGEEGFGLHMREAQDPETGMWAGGAYFPAHTDLNAADDDEPQPWTATTWSLTALREWGVDSEQLGDTAARLEEHAHWEYEDLPYWGGEVCVCINALTLRNGLWLGRDMTDLAHWFVDHAADEGGWNCNWADGAKRASATSTLNGLVGILSYERQSGGSDALRSARAMAEEYLLQRRLSWRVSDGAKMMSEADQFTYPHRWYYSVLRALDYFRQSHEHEGGVVDSRLDDAVQLVRDKRRTDGTWARDWDPGGAVWFEVDAPPGEPSPWITFEALRVLRWWEGAR